MELLELPKVMPIVVRSLGSGPGLAPLSLMVAGIQISRMILGWRGCEVCISAEWMGSSLFEALVGVSKNFLLKSKIWASAPLSLGLSAPLLWALRKVSVLVAHFYMYHFVSVDYPRNVLAPFQIRTYCLST